jgi:hypothetical protein
VSEIPLSPQVWVGDGEPTAAGVKPLNVSEYPRFKPRGGFWTSTWHPRTGGGWVQWCIGEQWGVPADGCWHAWLLTPDPTARIYTIGSYADLADLYGRFPRDPAGAHAGLLASCPDWKAIAGHYDAIHLADRGQVETRFGDLLGTPGTGTPHLSLYGWDCESTLWYRWAFTSAEYLGQRKFEYVEWDERDSIEASP